MNVPYLNIREIGANNTIHDTPDIRDWVLVADLDLKLIPNQAPGTLAAEEVLGADVLNHVRVQALEIHLNGIGWVLAVVIETSDRPGSVDSRPGLFDLVQENPLNLTLVDKGGERISGVDKSRARGPAPTSVNTFAIGERIPESNIVHLRGLVRHDLTLEAQIPEDLGGTRLDTVGTASRGGNRAVIDMLHLVAPSRHTEGQQDANRTCAHDHNIVFLLLCVDHDGR